MKYVTLALFLLLTACSYGNNDIAFGVKQPNQVNTEKSDKL